MAGAWLGASPVCLGGRASPRSRRLRALGLGSLGAGLASAPALRRRGARAAASSEDRDRRSGEAKKTMGRPAEGGVSVGDSMMAGAFAGMLSRVAVAPLDVIKIRMQVQVEPVGPRRGALGAGKYRGIAQCARTILKEEGARGLWAGTVPALFLWVPYTAVQFAALGEFKRVARENGGDPEKPPLAFAGGAVAGATATVVTYPFDVMRTVLAAQGSPRVYESLPAAAAGILKSRGPAGLYAGVGVTLLEIVPASAIQFGVYALLRNIALAEDSQDPRSRDSTPRAVSPLANAACGFGAGSVARVIIHPLDVVKKRFQVAGLARSLRYGERVAAAEFSSFASAFGTILRKEGVRGFYKGLTPGLIKSAPASAITFAAYEAASRFVATARRRAEEGSGGGGGA
jgi:solute carrier family 25 thiamine pyrophosphate transporter 19